MTFQIKQNFKYLGHKQAIYCLASNDSSCFFSSGADGYVVKWEINNPDGDLIMQSDAPVYAILIIDSNRILVANAKGMLYVYDLSEKIIFKAIQAHESAIFSLAASENYIVSGDQNGWLHIWDKNLQLIAKKRVFLKSIRSIQYLKNNQWLISGSDCRVALFDFDKKEMREINSHQSTVFAAVADQNKENIYSVGRDAILKKTQLSDSKELNAIPAHTLHIHTLSLCMNDSILITGSMDKTIKVWQCSDMKLLKVLDFQRHQAHLSSVNTLLCLQNNLFLSAGDDKQIICWKMDTN